MNTQDPSADRLPGGQRRCTARRTDGQRCNAPAISGATVCRVHGGQAPQVRRAAKLRLLDLVDPAIATLAREMTNQAARPSERIRAAEAVLDRAGHPRQVQVATDDQRELAKQKLLQLLAERVAAEEERIVQQASEIVEGQVVEDDSSAPDGTPGGRGDEQPPPVQPDTPDQPKPGDGDVAEGDRP